MASNANNTAEQTQTSTARPGAEAGAAESSSYEDTTAQPNFTPSATTSPSIPAPAPKPAELPVYLLPLAGGAAFLSALALAIAVLTYLRLGQTRRQLRRTIQDLNKRLDGRDNTAAPTLGQQPPKAASTTATETAQRLMTAMAEARAAQNTSAASAASPFLPPLINPDEPAPPAPLAAPAAAPTVSKVGLIQALNQGDRQTLRDCASAPLNITKESENALAVGRSQPTQLEKVSGGGSYWLVMLAGEALLFPTDITLKGFLSMQPSKGLFSYEKQVVSNPQLIEPALLRQDGERWTVERLGRIAVP